MLTFDAVPSRTTMDMAILLEADLSENQGVTPEGYLVCKNVPVSRTAINDPQKYYGYEISPKLPANKIFKVYRLPEDVFEPASLQSIESKPITDDHPQEAVTVSNNRFLSRGHGRNIRHDDKHVIADLICTDPDLIQGIRDKRKYEISLGYLASYVPYKDGFKQTNIRVNHIAVVESGRAGKKVSIKDSVPAKNRRHRKMDKTTALATMFAAFAKDASPEEVAAMLPFVTDAAPATVTKTEAKDDNKGLIALLGGMLSKDTKPAAPAAEALTLTADGIAKMIADEVAKALKTAAVKDKSAKDSDEKEVEKMLEDSDEDDDEKEKTAAEDEDPDEKKETEDDDDDDDKAKEAKDAAIAAIAKSLRPLYKTLSAKDQKIVKDQLVKARKKPTADSYSEIMKVVQKHTKDAVPPTPIVDLQSVSDRVMEKAAKQHGLK